MFRRFVVAHEEGAVSADWLALGAGLVALVLTLVASLREGPTSLGEAVSRAMQTAHASALEAPAWAE